MAERPTLAETIALLEQAQAVAHVGSWVVELDGGRPSWWSAETHRIFGVVSDEPTHTAGDFYALVHTDDRDAVRAASDAAVAGGPPFDIEHRIVRPDGKVRWVHERASVDRDAGGTATRLIGTVQDVTDRRQLEEQLRQAQKMEAIGRLAGGIAHDLNNALTAIAGYAELALGQLTTEHGARPDVDEIRKAAERAGSVTRQLLAFSRKQLLEPRVFDLNDTVAGITRLLARLLGTDVSVTMNLADAPLAVGGDPGQVEQAIVNLAVNARDAMPSGGVLTLTTAREIVSEHSARTMVPMPPGEYVVLHVSDTGHGIPSDVVSRIFEPFFTTKDVGKGTGLGLSMVYGTLKQIGGFVFVDSELHRGTTFHLFFPPAAVAPAKAVRSEPASAGRSRGNETVLVAEDEPAVRNLVASALKKDGYRLLLAASAEEALRVDAAEERPVDLLLTDAIMPGRSGVDLAREMRRRHPQLRIIVMSGYTDDTLDLPEPDVPLLMLQKPFTPRDLRKRIREALDA